MCCGRFLIFNPYHRLHSSFTDPQKKLRQKCGNPLKTVGVAVCCKARQGVYDPDALTCLIFDPAKIRVSALYPCFPHRPKFALIMPFSRSFGYYLCPGRFCAVLGLKNAQALCVFRFLIRSVGCLPYPCDHFANSPECHQRFVLLLPPQVAWQGWLVLPR